MNNRNDRRHDVIAKFDAAVRALADYIDHADSAERARLVGQLPALREARADFERATSPYQEEASDERV